MPAEALEVVRTWGFALKTMKGFTWHKTTKHGKSHFGMGRLNARQTEARQRGRSTPRSMKELYFNLWYWLNAQQQIFAIAAKAYLLDGSEEDKEAALADLSLREYQSVPAVPLADPLHYSELKRRGIEEVYEEEFERIRKSLPHGVPFPEDKLYYPQTPLFDFGQGYVPALIGDGYIRERQ